MVEPEALVEHRLELAPGRVAIGLASTSTCAASAGKPEVIVHTCRSWTSLTPGTAAIASPTSSDVHACGRALEQDLNGVAQDRPRADQDQHADRHRDHRVGVLPAGGEDDQGGEDHPGRAEQVGDHVAEGGRDVEALARVPLQDPRGDQVDDQPGDRDRQHQARLDLGRVAEPGPGLDEDPDRDRDQGDAVEERREDLGSPVAEGAARAPGAGGEPGREQGDAEREAVGEHVRGVGEQRQAARDQAAGDLGDQEQRGQREDQLQGALGAGAVEVDRVRVVVSAGAVHGSKVLAATGV